ncbi:MAG: PEP-CTERM sorting domain-containing protein [Phycisphaeraceae bacterium]|nr:PEP-CTERM sorting domain-containing protein [Phycisphaeraceae bacterium]
MRIRDLTICAATVIALGLAGATRAAVINEIRIDQPSSDNSEFFELYGSPGESLAGLAYIVIGDGTGGSGVIERVIDLNSFAIPASGFFLDINPANVYSVTGDTTLSNDTFENSDNVTHLLVSGFSGANGNDLDINDDGVLDSTPWTSIIDGLSIIEEANPPAATEYSYAASLGLPVVGPDGAFAPGLVYRSPDGGAWLIGAFDPADVTPGAYTGTPGTTNVIPEPASLALIGLGAVAMLRRRGV